MSEGQDLDLLAMACDGYRRFLLACQERETELRASLQMALERIEELERDRERLLRAIEAYAHAREKLAETKK